MHDVRDGGNVTRRVGDVIVLEPTAPVACAFCGEVAECRPYGPDDKDICHPCAMKPEYKAIAEAAFMRQILGVES